MIVYVLGVVIIALVIVAMAMTQRRARPKPSPPADRAWAGPHGYDDTPLAKQWSSVASRAADQSRWRPCGACAASIPVVEDTRFLDSGDVELPGTVTYVCPHCRHVHLGNPNETQEAREQQRCFDCRTALDDSATCPSCGLPRAWMTVACPTCGNRQAVSVPHMLRPCDLFHLECVACGNVYDSFCIC